MRKHCHTCRKETEFYFRPAMMSLPGGYVCGECQNPDTYVPPAPPHRSYGAFSDESGSLGDEFGDVGGGWADRPSEVQRGRERYGRGLDERDQRGYSYSSAADAADRQFRRTLAEEMRAARHPLPGVGVVGYQSTPADRHNLAFLLNIAPNDFERWFGFLGLDSRLVGTIDKASYQAAWRAGALVCHPDRNPIATGEHAERFKSLHENYRHAQEQRWM